MALKLEDRELWVNDNYKNEYFKSENRGFFCLCMVGGSISSIKTYKDKDEAIEDGWKVKLTAHKGQGVRGMKYRKLPVIIEAIQWIGNLPFPEEFEAMGYLEHPNGHDLIISTLEGSHICSMNDYIIKGVKGEFYPCEPDIFEMTYELVNE